MAADPNKVLADPSKEFFIDILTRDIGALECVLDLIDNPVDNVIATHHESIEQIAFALEPEPVFADKFVAVTMSERTFKIDDNCGGISVAKAREHAFKFGSSAATISDQGIGAYGIGMKRAIFKLGRHVVIRSADDKQEFQITIDVDEWKVTKEWNFRFDYIKPAKTYRERTTITITRLNPDVRDLLHESAYQGELLRRMGRTYAAFIQSGLEISLNGEAAEANLPEMAISAAVQPGRHHFTQGGVKVWLMAGLTPVDFSDEYGGWYVFCNGRLLLEADRTYRTGWGSEFPKYHTKYNHFVGLVLFFSRDPKRLPWTTTKDNVEIENPVYLKALSEMKSLARPITSFLNKVYANRAPDDRPEQASWLAAGASSPGQAIYGSPLDFEIEAESEEDDPQVRISYWRKKSLVDFAKVLARKPSLSNSRIGELTFDYYLDKEGD